MGIERRFRGEGAFFLANGRRLETVAFRIEQEGSGATFLYCAPTIQISIHIAMRDLAGFEGTTNVGNKIRTHGNLDRVLRTSNSICIGISKVEVGEPCVNATKHELSLTNVDFSTEYPRPLALTVNWGGAAIEVRLTPHRGYESRIRDLHKASGVVPTALLAFQSSSLEIGAVDDFIMDLCNGFSVAQGRKVNWIQHARYLKPRIFQQSIFGRNITKAYATSPLCFIPGSRTPLALALTDSISVVSAIAQFRKKFDPHSILVNAWLDARTETDYLEGRTLKYVVVLEALNALTTSVDKAIASKPVDTGSWRLLYKQIVASMPTTIPVALPTLERWQQLNSLTFRDTLSKVCEHHGIDINARDLSLFSNIRNNIVHRFNYDLDLQLPDEWLNPAHPQAAQHFFVADFVDRVILQLFGLGKKLRLAS
jgi:hypothetical protein